VHGGFVAVFFLAKSDLEIGVRCEVAKTALNIRYTLRRSSGLAYEKMQSAYGLCAWFLRHIFAVAELLRIPLSQSQKRRKPFT
jgi:hypothetical protein